MEDAILTMLVAGLAAGLLAGGVGGALAGLAGLGGGLIYVPVFYACLPQSGSSMATAVFASMLAIVATGFASARSHWRLGHIDTPACRRLLPGLVFGAALGLMFTLKLPEALVLAGLALLDVWVARDYGRVVRPESGDAPLLLTSVPIGYISGSLGIGGGTMLVPVLRRLLPLRGAVGTSALCGTLMAAGALLLNLLFEPQWLGLLQDAVPFMLGAAAGMLLVLPRAVNRAARLHARLDEADIQVLLRFVFLLLAALLTLAALYRGLA